MIEIDGVKYEKVVETNDATCDDCDRFDIRHECKRIGCGLGGFILKRIKEEVMFKKGDRVVCVDVCSDASYTIGREYIIDRINLNAAHGGLIYAIDDCGNLQGMYAKRFKPAPQYTTRPIDYTGCDPVIAEYLKRSESILCEVWDEVSTARTGYIVAYDCGDDFPYETFHSAFANAKPIPRKRTEIRVKKASEIVAWLECNGYEVNSDGDWCKSFGDDFLAQMFAYCGKKPDTHFGWHLEWIDEVECS